MLNNEFKIVVLFHMTGTLKGKVTWITEKENLNVKITKDKATLISC